MLAEQNKTEYSKSMDAELDKYMQDFVKEVIQSAIKAAIINGQDKADVSASIFENIVRAAYWKGANSQIVYGFKV